MSQGRHKRNPELGPAPFSQAATGEIGEDGRERDWADLLPSGAHRKEIEKAKVMAPEMREALERGRFEALRHDDGRFDAGSRLTQKGLTLLFSVKESAPFLT